MADLPDFRIRCPGCPGPRYINDVETNSFDTVDLFSIFSSETQFSLVNDTLVADVETNSSDMVYLFAPGNSGADNSGPR